jgi:hypothetical protein
LKEVSGSISMKDLLDLILKEKRDESGSNQSYLI